MSILDLIPDIVGSIGLILLSIVSISHTKQIAELKKKVSFLVSIAFIESVLKSGDLDAKVLAKKEEQKHTDEESGTKD